MNMQINQTKQVSYGATEHVPGNPFAQQQTMQFNQQPMSYNQAPPYSQQPESYNPTAPTFNPTPGNPFAYPNAIQEEPVQPYSTDSYMHGTAEDRGFQRNY